MKKNFPNFDRGLSISSPLSPREKKQKKEEPRRGSSGGDDKIRICLRAFIAGIAVIYTGLADVYHKFRLDFDFYNANFDWFDCVVDLNTRHEFSQPPPPSCLDGAM